MGALISAIAQGVKPVNFGILTPTQQGTQLATLEGIKQENLLRQQQTQQANLQNQITQRTINDQDIMRQAFQGVGPSGNLDDVYSKAQQAGASPEALMNLMNHTVQYKQNAAKLDETNQALLGTHLDRISGLLDSANSATDPDQAQRAYGQAYQEASKYGLTGQLGMSPGYPGKDDTSFISSTLKTHSQVLADQKAAREQAESASKQALEAAQAGQAGATTAETQQKTATAQRSEALQQLTGVETQDQYDALKARYPQVSADWPAMYSPKAAAQLTRAAVPVEKQPSFDLETSQAKALKAMVDEDPEKLDALVDQIVPPNDPMNASTKVLMRRSAAFGDAKGVQKVLQDAYDQRGRVQTAKETQANRIQLELGGLGGLGGSPGQPSSLAQAVANYQMPLSSAVGRGGPAVRNQLLGQVLAANPNFQEQYYQTFQKTENDATSGKTATSANALNTMMGHLEVLDKAADALKNGDVQGLNRIANFIGAQTGQTAPVVYDTIVHRLGPEVTKAYLASGGSTGERGANEEDFSRNLGPDQIKANIGVSALLADSKIKALQDQYTRGTYGRGKQKLISDEAENARQRLAGRASGLAPATAPPVGTVSKGYRFKGGDPKLPGNWEKVQQ